MSGSLDVKLPLKSQKGFSSWKVWKKQWCTLRPCPIKNGITIVFHLSVGMSSNTQIEIPKNVIICRVHSKTKAYSFGIFTADESQKPLLYMSGQSENESQIWMSRIRAMINGKHCFDKCIDKNNYFDTSIIDNEFSKRCGFRGLHGFLIINSDSFEICDHVSNDVKATFDYNDIQDIELVAKDDKSPDYNKICAVNFKSSSKFGVGSIYFYSPFAKMLTNVLRRRMSNCSNYIAKKLSRRFSKSEGSLSRGSIMSHFTNEESSDSESAQWYVDSEDIDDQDIILRRKRPNNNVISPKPRLDISKSNANYYNTSKHASCSLDRRCSSTSEIYEEIYDVVKEPLTPKNKKEYLIQNTYEILKDLKYNNSDTKSNNPPPLPPRYLTHKWKFNCEEDSGLDEEWLQSLCTKNERNIKSPSISSSTGSIGAISNNSPIGCKPAKNSSRFHNAIDAFRKRIKSESKSDKSNPELTEAKGCDSNPSPRLKFRNKRLDKIVCKSAHPSHLNTATTNATSCETLNVPSNPDYLYGNRLSKSQDFLDANTFHYNGSHETIAKLKRYARDFTTDWSNVSNDENAEDLSILCVESKSSQRFDENEYVLMSPPRLMNDDYVIMR